MAPKSINMLRTCLITLLLTTFTQALAFDRSNLNISSAPDDTFPISQPVSLGVPADPFFVDRESYSTSFNHFVGPGADFETVQQFLIEAGKTLNRQAAGGRMGKQTPIPGGFFDYASADGNLEFSILEDEPIVQINYAEVEIVLNAAKVYLRQWGGKENLVKGCWVEFFSRELGGFHMASGKLKLFGKPENDIASSSNATAAAIASRQNQTAVKFPESK